MDEFKSIIPSLDPVRVRLKTFSFANAQLHLLRPCTVAESSRECWLLDSLTEINDYLAPACLEIEETLSTQTALRTRPWDGKADSDPMVVAAFLAYFLLRHHDCIQVLDFHSTQLPMSARHAVAMALRHTRCLEEVNFSGWYQEPLGKNSRLSDNLPELSSLRKLALNPPPADAGGVAKAIVRNRGIRELEIGGEGLSHKELRKVLKAIGSCYRLTSLHLSEILASPTSTEWLSQLLESQSSCLTKLSLYDVTSVLVNSVLVSLQSNGTLETLSISCVRQQGAYSLDRIAALKSNRTLKNLLVHECLVHTGDIADMLKINSTVEELALTVCQLLDEDATLLAEAIEVNDTLQKLDVQDNRLSAESVIVFARSLVHNKHLQVLDMGYVYFTPDCIDTVASILQETKPCGRLLVSWNKPGLVELASVLCDPQVSMRKLCLDWHADTSVSAAIADIFAALSVNKTVTELIIENVSGIDDAIGEQLVHSLRSNGSLKHVSIKSHFRKRAIMVALLEALKDNQSVSTLFFNYSIDSARVATAVGKMLEANRTIYSIYFDTWYLKGKSLLTLAAAILLNGVLLDFRLAIPGPHKFFTAVRDALRKNLVLLKRAVRFVVQHSEDEESKRAFSMLSGKESLLQTLVKITGKTEPEVKATINAAAQRTLSKQDSLQCL